MSLYKIVRMATLVWFAVVFFSYPVVRLAIAQEPSQNKSASVSVSVTHEVALTPEKIRLQMLVRAESREGENAMKVLQKQQERVTKDLIGLGADQSSIEFSKTILSMGTPGVDDPDIARRMIRQQQAQMAQMRNLNPQFRGQLPTLPDEDGVNELPQIFTATSTLIADWKLENGLDDAAILLPTVLRTAIDEKDFKGKKLKETLSSDEQVLAQPLMVSGIYSSTNRQPDLQLVYVAKMSESQEAEALAATYKKAQLQAEMLVKAAGRKLGNLRSISSSTNSVTQNFPPPYGLNVGIQMTTSVRKNVREVGSEDPNGLKQFVVVSVSFDIE